MAKTVTGFLGDEICCSEKTVQEDDEENIEYYPHSNAIAVLQLCA